MTDHTELRRLASKATPGPWTSLRDGNQFIETNYLPTAKGVGASRIPELARPWNPHAYVRFGFKPSEFETARFRDADADFIAAANPQAVLALLDEIAELKRMLHESLTQLEDDHGDGLTEPEQQWLYDYRMRKP